MVAKHKNSDLTVQAKDTYDPADYITVHRQFFDGLRNALRRAHGGKCICIYCGTEEQPRMETSSAHFVCRKSDINEGEGS